MHPADLFLALFLGLAVLGLIELGDWLKRKNQAGRGQERECGYSSLNELESIRGPGGLTIERDLHFTPKPTSEIADIK